MRSRVSYSNWGEERKESEGEQCVCACGCGWVYVSYFYLFLHSLIVSGCMTWCDCSMSGHYYRQNPHYRGPTLQQLQQQQQHRRAGPAPIASFDDLGSLASFDLSSPEDPTKGKNDYVYRQSLSISFCVSYLSHDFISIYSSRVKWSGVKWGKMDSTLSSFWGGIFTWDRSSWQDSVSIMSNCVAAY